MVEPDARSSRRLRVARLEDATSADARGRGHTTRLFALRLRIRTGRRLSGRSGHRACDADARVGGRYVCIRLPLP